MIPSSHWSSPWASPACPPRTVAGAAGRRGAARRRLRAGAAGRRGRAAGARVVEYLWVTRATLVDRAAIERW